MSRLVFAIVGLIFVVNASAQGINSPQALANAVASAISSGKSASLAELFSPETNVNSKKYAIQDFMAYKGAAHLSAKPVHPGDKNWVGEPLPLLLKKLADHSYAFPTKPLGRIIISGQRSGQNNISMASAFYGKLGNKYLLIFAKPAK